MKVYHVWEIINDYPEGGGGVYLRGTYITREKAEARKRKLEELLEDENEDEDEDYQEEVIEYKIETVEAL